MQLTASCSRSELTNGRSSFTSRRLADEVDKQLPGWFVDVEYDNWHGADPHDLKKRMRAALPEPQLADGLPELGADAAEDKFKDVYPDIIVHDRAGLGAEHNLLVVEVKKEERDGHAADIAKLRGFLASPFCYQRAVFVVLPKDGGMPRCLPIS